VIINAKDYFGHVRSLIETQSYVFYRRIPMYTLAKPSLMKLNDH